MKGQNLILSFVLQCDVTSSKLYPVKNGYQIRSILLLFLLGHIAFFKKAANNFEKKSQKTTLETAFIEEKSLKQSNMNQKKMPSGPNEINDLLLFIVYCGIMFAFFIFIWNIRLENWYQLILYFGIIFTIFVIILLLLLKGKRIYKKKK